MRLKVLIKSGSIFSFARVFFSPSSFHRFRKGKREVNRALQPQSKVEEEKKKFLIA
jgi:hypothetical protein